MADQQLLSDLCSVCHAHPHKYKCPGCSSRTCSLECVKRHKKRADCSGSRDATAFVKKSQLFTPAGVDHDFNFLRGIERQTDNAAELFEEATADPWHDRSGRRQQYAIANALRRAGVYVERAPKGLTRQLQNRTRWATGARSIMWTVEWVEHDASRDLEDVSERTPLWQAHSWRMRRLRGEKPARREGGKRRKLLHDDAQEAVGSGKEHENVAGDQDRAEIAGDLTVEQDTLNGGPEETRARSNDRPVSSDGCEQNNPAPVEGDIESRATPSLQEPAESTVSSTNTAKTATADIAAADNTNVDKDVDNQPVPHSITEQHGQTESTGITDLTSQNPPDKADETLKVDPGRDPEAESHKAEQPEPELPVGAPDPQGCYYYLVKPRTTIRDTVLIPLSPTAPLSASLRGRRVIEFPTVTVLPQPPAALPAGFVLETEYLAVAERQQREMERLVAQDGSAAASASSSRSAHGGAGKDAARDDKPRQPVVPNSSDIMAILQRDILG